MIRWWLRSRHLPTKLFSSLHDVDWRWDRLDLRNDALETEYVGAARLGWSGWTIKGITFFVTFLVSLLFYM